MTNDPPDGGGESPGGQKRRVARLMIDQGPSLPEENASVDSVNQMASEKAIPPRKDSLADILLRPAKTFRDPIHRDIMLTTLEVALVDTSDFQRLRRIKQLGTAYEVFPSALHTRFEHSIGTVQCAQKIIDAINHNPYPGISGGKQLRVSAQDTFLIRLCALLHDLSHVPFGHTLEDEARLMPSQWNDESRVRKFLGINSEIAKVLRADSTLRDLSQRKPGYYDEFRPLELEPDALLDNIRSVLVAIESNKVDELPKPFIADIVGNTLCADLLDYIKRDMYFLGLQETFDERFVTYVHLAYHDKKLRTVLRLIKPKTRELRRDVLSEFLQLLRLRYSLAEKALYHHTKVSTSAMISSAVVSVIAESSIDEVDHLFDRLCAIGDEELLADLRASQSVAARRLAEAFARRCLVKPAYLFTRSEPGDPHFEDKDAVVRQFIGSSLLPTRKEPIAGPKENEAFTKGVLARYAFERGLERVNGLQPGDVVLYCPPAKMGVKLIKTLVQVGPTTMGPAEDLLKQDIMNEFRYSIADKHRELWRLAVFVSAEAKSILDTDLTPGQIRANVGGDAATALGVPNEVQHNTVCLPYIQRYEDYYVKETGEKRLAASTVEQIAEAGTRGGEIDWLPYSSTGDTLDYKRKRRDFAK